MVAAGAFLYGGTHAANLVMVVVCCLTSAFLIWHSSLVVSAHLVASPHPVMTSLLRAEIAIGLAMTGVGAMLLVLSSYRVIGEALPVFG
ncbi:hypothetical protein [Croceicoccus sp. Ery15]|uniref:hypothetical protein n=1 Tax=Croceicoccus sp. Ery15 TaxID=1703338 RepID=UPI001E37B7B1|nr:hypothetical protein [Croceicoccus sp. Ery15]